MSDEPKWSAPVLRWIQEGLEAGFSVGDPSWPEHPGKWGVHDAEMQLVAVCETEALAEIVCAAMGTYDIAMNQQWLSESSEAYESRPALDADRKEDGDA